MTYNGTNYTLDEWSKKTGVPYNYLHDSILIYSTNLINISALSSWQLYHLTDYAVSSQVAGVCWLVPRN